MSADCAPNGARLRQPVSDMAIKVILYRRVPADRAAHLRPLLVRLRALAQAQRGYVSGETLMNSEDPEQYLVLSTWESEDDWDAWFNNQQRAGVQREIDALLGSETLYQVYYSA
jgi:heme oxygenase (mycobilin-producing)